MTKKFILAAVVLASVLAAKTQNVNRPESYNYQRGVEALQEEKYEESVEYFNKDLKENPKNGYSYSWVAHLRLRVEDYGRALNAVNQAIKYLPKKDVEYVTFAYSTRAFVRFIVDFNKQRRTIAENGGIKTIFKPLIDGLLEYRSARIIQDEKDFITIDGTFTDPIFNRECGLWSVIIQPTFKILNVKYQAHIDLGGGETAKQM